MTAIANIRSILDCFNDLKLLPRTGWLFAGVAQPESVAEHTCAVALLAMLLAEAINQDPTGEGLPQPLEIGYLAQIALLHDLAESVITDLPHRSTALIGKNTKHLAEEQAMQRILAGWPNHERWLTVWRDYDCGKSAEARLVRDADKLEMVHQALRYRRCGHNNLAEFWMGHCWHFLLSKAVFERLLASDGVVE